MIISSWVHVAANGIISLLRQWHPTPVLLPGKSHGWRSLVGCSPWGREESDMTERLHFHFHALEKEMATYSSVLAWRIPGTGEPGRLPSMGSHRVGHDWSDLAVAVFCSIYVPFMLCLFISWWTFRLFPCLQIRSVAQSCPTLCDPMNHSTPGLSVHHQLLEFTQTHVYALAIVKTAAMWTRLLFFGHSVVFNSLWPRGLQPASRLCL